MLRTAEAVTPAHPDKVADQISDEFVRRAYLVDDNPRVAIETMIGHNGVAVCGEMTSTYQPDKFEIEDIVKTVMKRNRYEDYKFNLIHNIKAQSLDIARGVDVGGAGDQGIMIGYACMDNEARIPQELYLARKILRTLWFGYAASRDAKCQVTIDTENNNKPVCILLSAERISTKSLTDLIYDVVDVPDGCEIIVNPAGDWDGGFDADTGVTGRKIVQDAYGPRVPVGGGAFSGKDSTKVDRTAAYMARAVALTELENRYHKMVVDDIKVEVAYAIGKPEPLSLVITANSYSGNGNAETSRVINHNRSMGTFTPVFMHVLLEMKKVPYDKISAWGHFGHDGLSWEIWK